MVHRACQCPEEIFQCLNLICNISSTTASNKEEKRSGAIQQALCVFHQLAAVLNFSTEFCAVKTLPITVSRLTFCKNYWTFYRLLMIAVIHWHHPAFSMSQWFLSYFLSCKIGCFQYELLLHHPFYQKRYWFLIYLI